MTDSQEEKDTTGKRTTRLSGLNDRHTSANLHAVNTASSSMGQTQPSHIGSVLRIANHNNLFHMHYLYNPHHNPVIYCYYVFPLNRANIGPEELRNMSRVVKQS